MAANKDKEAVVTHQVEWATPTEHTHKVESKPKAKPKAKTKATKPKAVSKKSADLTPYPDPVEVAGDALRFAQHRLTVANSYNDRHQRAAKVEEATKELEAAEVAYEKAKKDASR